ADFGSGFDQYFATANDKLTTIVQVETEGTLEHVGEIAAIDGVDVLFVGPLDLSVSLGIPQQFDHPRFREALARVSDAALARGKAAGILLLNPDQIEQTVADGYTFIALGSDGGVLASGLRQLAEAFGPFRQG
ncbi:MAG: 2-dehydro-3-deoxyglucarate aldolase, partial [Thermoleophilia bacterium]|nr:2-dehydro-3-deoxyglucarate aldolase [Thermoleophilia bacterium]